MKKHTILVSGNRATVCIKCSNYNADQRPTKHIKFGKDPLQLDKGIGYWDKTLLAYCTRQCCTHHARLCTPVKHYIHDASLIGAVVAFIDFIQMTYCVPLTNISYMMFLDRRCSRSHWLY